MGRPKGSKNKPKDTFAQKPTKNKKIAPVAVVTSLSLLVEQRPVKRRGRPPKVEKTASVQFESSLKPAKRRGRPPKNEKELSTSEVETSFDEIEETESKYQTNQINPFETTIEICECNLEPIKEWSNVLEAETTEEYPMKLGIYSSCRLPIKATGRIFPVVAYIKTDIEKHRLNGMSDRQIYLGCINYLNASKSKRKNSKKGLGDLYPYSFNIISDKISAMFLTTERKSKFFWREGTI